MDNIRKFAELIRTDTSFQDKLKAAAESYTGERTTESVFYGILAPVAEEYDIHLTFDEFKDFLEGSGEMDKDELVQIAGGGDNGHGLGEAACLGIGVGVGGGVGSGAGGICIVAGIGWGQFDCILQGETSTV